MEIYFSDFKTILITSATITTIFQFLSGVFICKKFINKGTTGDASGFSFVAGVLNCVMWLKYGQLIEDNSVILVNFIGGILQLCYLILYYLYCDKKTQINKQIIGTCLIISITMSYSYLDSDKNRVKEIFGLISSGFSILFFGAPLTMLIHVIRVKSTENLPFILILASFLVSGQWFLYGCLINDTFIQVPNFLGCCLAGFQLSLFVFFPKKQSTKIPLLPH